MIDDLGTLSIVADELDEDAHSNLSFQVVRHLAGYRGHLAALLLYPDDDEGLDRILLRTFPVITVHASQILRALCSCTLAGAEPDVGAALFIPLPSTRKTAERMISWLPCEPRSVVLRKFDGEPVELIEGAGQISVVGDDWNAEAMKAAIETARGVKVTFLAMMLSPSDALARSQFKLILGGYLVENYGIEAYGKAMRRVKRRRRRREKERESGEF